MDISRNLIANYLGQFWRAVMAFAFIPIYINLLGIESYGLIGLFAIFQSMLALFDMGMKPALARETAKISENFDLNMIHKVRNLLRSVELISICIVFFLILIIYVSSPWIASQWLKSESLDYAVIETSILIFSGICILQFLESIYTSCLAGLQRQVLLNVLISSFATVKGLGAVFILYFISPTILAFFLWQLFISLLSFIAICLCLYRVFPKSEQHAKFSFKEIKGVWKYASGLFGITFLALMLTQTDKIILSNLLSLTNFGYYSFVSAVVVALYFLVTPVTATYFPKFVALIESKESSLLKDAYQQSSELVAVLMGIAGIFLAINSQSILWIWTQDQEIVKNTHYILSILSISTVFNGVLWIPMQMQLAHGVTRITLKVNIFLILMTIPLFIILVPIYQLVGAALITLGMNIFALVANLIYMNKFLMKGQNLIIFLRYAICPLLIPCFICIGFNSFFTPFDNTLFEIFRLTLILFTMIVSGLLSTSYLKKQAQSLLNNFLKN